MPVTTVPSSAPSRTTLDRVGITLAVLAVLYAGSWVMLPGLDAQALSDPNHPVLGSSMIARLSIMSLGATPLISAAVVIEILRIISARIRKGLPGPIEDGPVKTVVFFLGLAFTILQARGVAIGVEGIPNLVPEPGPLFRTKVLFAFVAATTAYAYGAHVIDRKGVGSGLWVVSAVPLIASAPMLALVTLQATSDLGLEVGLAPLMFAIITVGITLGLISKDRALVSSGQLIWSATVAPAALMLLILPLALVPLLEALILGSGIALEGATWLDDLKARSQEIMTLLSMPQGLAVVLPLLFVGVMVLRDRSLREAGLPSADSTLKAAIVLAGLAGAGLYAGAALGTVVRLDAFTLIMLTALAVTIVDRLSALRARTP